MKIHIIAAAIVCILTSGTPYYKLEEDKRMDKCITAYMVTDLNGKVLAQWNGNLPMIPASLTKLITTSAALDELGEDFRFETSLAYSGEIRSGVLEGDLYICGGGDPSLGKDRKACDTVFYQWLRAIRAAGIDSIGGRIIGDDRIFSGDEIMDSWQWSDLGTYYGSGAYGLNFGENSIHFRCYPGEKAGDKAVCTQIWPQTPWMDIGFDVITAASGKSSVNSYVSPGYPRIEVKGMIARDRKYINNYAANKYPALTCAWLFGEFLEYHGIGTSGGYMCTDEVYGDVFENADSLVTIHTTLSGTLAEIISETNKSSNNLYAEALLRMTGLHKRGSSSYTSSIGAVREILATAGVDSTSFIICDGSGLSRNNHISPASMCRFLRCIAGQEYFDTFVKSLPYPGGEGTLEYVLKDTETAVKKRIRAKSGSMTGVRCYAGYIMGARPEDTKVFTVMTGNNLRKNAAVQPAIEAFLKSLASGK